MRLAFVPALVLIGACSSGDPDERARSLDRVHQDQRCAEAVTPFEPEAGVVSSEAIAKDVAHQYLNAIYGRDDNLRPLVANLRNGVWTVHGTLPKWSVGGVAQIELCQSNGRVLEITHGK